MACVAILALQYVAVFAQQPQQPAPTPQQGPPQQGTPPPGTPQQGNPPQQGSPQQGSQQGTGTPPNQGQNPPQQQVPKAHDVITKTRGDLTQTQPQPRGAKPISIDSVPKRSVDIGDQVTFKIVGRDPSVLPGIVLSYQLVGAPQGAFVDPMTGMFSWYPQSPGTYTFIAVVSDNSEPVRIASIPITVVVNQALQIYGLNFFERARAIIDYRLAAIKTGANLLSLAPAPGTGQAANSQNVPFVTSLSQAISQGLYTPLPPAGPTGQLPAPNGMPGPVYQTQQGSGASGQQTPGQQGQQNQPGQQPGNGQANPQLPGAAPLTGNIGQLLNQLGQGNGQQQVGQPQTPSQTAGSPQYGQPNAATFGNAPSQLNLPGIGLVPAPQNWTNPQNGDNSLMAEAIKYFVGPFDMLGLNVFVPSPERYQLGPGDLLSIRFWSPTVPAQEVDAKVDMRGQLTIPTNGQKITVRGKTLDSAQQLLKVEITKDIKNAEVSLTLKALRTMAISVMGDAYEPGNFQVPAVATLFNAIYMFGGPSDQGSLRHIELRHNDGKKDVFDLYRFLIDGDTSQDVPLQPGDAIWIAPALSHVSVKGEVRRPDIYEAEKGEHLSDIIHYAGGTKATGVAQRVSLETVEPGVGRQLRDVDLSVKTPASDPLVYDGDLATVFSVREIYTNRVTIDGAVDQPGDYAYTSGMTVADLIMRSRGLIREAYTVRADLQRLNLDKTTALIRIDLAKAMQRDPSANVELKPFDSVHVYALNEVAVLGERQATIKGAVQKPGQYYRSDNMKVLDILLQAGGLALDAAPDSVFLQRTNPDGTLGPISQLDLRKLAAGDGTQNLELQDKDVITVLTVQEKSYVPLQSVNILGAVQAPGSYPRGSNMKLKDLVRIAGGPMPNAGDSLEIAHARVAVNSPRTKVSLGAVMAGGPDGEVPLQDGDLVTLAARSDIQLEPLKVILIGAVKHPGPYPVNGQTDRLSALISRAGGFMPGAFPEGTQFARDPKLLQTDSQNRVTPRILEAINEVALDEYKREFAKAQQAAVQWAKSVNSGSVSATIPGLGATSQADQGINIPQQLISNPPVTPARPLTDDDLAPGGNVNVNLPGALKHQGGRDDLVLRDGDIIVIPERPTTVSVVGAVVVPSAVLFSSGRHLSTYVKLAGGFSVDAAKERILVIRYGGLVTKADDHTRIELGDIIWVPTRVMADRLSDRAAEVDAISKTVTSGAILFAVLKSLLKF